MKRKIILLLLPLMIVFLSACQRTRFPVGMIYNYYENNDRKCLILSAKDYVVAADMQSKYLYSKRDKSFDLVGTTVFDLQENSLGLLCVNGNTLYYYAVDERTNGSIIYSLNLESMEKQEIDRKNTMSNMRGFLGIDRVLGIAAPVNDVMQLMYNRIWFNQNGRLSASDIYLRFQKEGIHETYHVSENIEKYATTDQYVFFLNDINLLYRYGLSDHSVEKLSNDIITDFFITASFIYFYDAEKQENLCMMDYNGGGFKEIGSIRFSDIRFRNDCIYGVDVENRIYMLKDSTITMLQNKATSFWDTDGDTVYYWDVENKSIAEAAIVYNNS